jgi:outer membrane biosynthesis protein TonB
MKNIHEKSVQVFGFVRIIAFVLLAIITVFATIKASAIAPHAPDIALDVKIDTHRKSVENSNNQKASQKVDTYKKYKQDKKKAPKKEKTSKSKTKTKKPKTAKPPKPSKTEKKKARKHKTRTLA